MKRDDLLQEQLYARFPNDFCRWLDVGAGDGTVSKELSDILPKEHQFFECVDVKKPTNPKAPVNTFDGTGKHLLELYKPEFNGDAFDFVLFNFVLHHAGRNLVGLLSAAKELTRCIVIQEDLNEPWFPPNTIDVSRELSRHDPKGIYGSQVQWEHLLQQTLDPRAIEVFRHPLEPLEDVPHYHVPRALFIVRL